MNPNEMSKPTRIQTTEEKITADAEKNARKSSYRQWAKTPSFKDLDKWLKLCYNEYQEASGALVDKDTRLSMLDQSLAFKKVMDYINRQVK